MSVVLSTSIDGRAFGDGRLMQVLTPQVPTCEWDAAYPPSWQSLETVPVGVPIQSRPRTGSRRRPLDCDWMGRGEPRDGWARWDEEAERRIHLESSSAVPRAATDSGALFWELVSDV